MIGDGAVWIWNLAGQHFPGALPIVAIYQARLLHRLDRGKIEALVKIRRDLHPANTELAQVVSHDAGYFPRHTARRRYPAFRAQALFVGSGVVEAGCRTVLASRLKRSGMFGTVRGANPIIAPTRLTP